MVDNPTIPSLADRLRTVQVGLRSDLEVSRHLFRRTPSYVVRNPITFQSHNLSTADYQIVIALDGEKSLGDVFDELVAVNQLQQEQEDEFYAFILSLHQLGFLNLPVTDGKVLYSRFKKRQAIERRSKITGFLFLRVPLINPDAMLERTVRFAKPLFTRSFFLLWLVLMMFCAGIIWQRWDDFREPVQSILVTKNLPGLWTLLVLLKVIHEFGHAYACKLFGGKVPEMGAFFICFTPCAYVDASASWGFASKRQRIAVSLAGMYVESIVAGIALLVWHSTGPSVVNSFAHQTVMLASIVTIGFNINPLMRYDGYYLLSDLVEIPNLRERSTTQLHSVCKRWLLGIRSDVLPFSLSGRVMLFIYGVLSSVWKVSLVTAICAGVALKIYIVGIAMAVIYGSKVLYTTVTKLIKYLWMSPETAPVRGRAIAMGAIALIGVPVGIASIPIPKSINIRGIVATKDERPIYAQASGVLRRSQVKAGQSVKANTVLYTVDNAHARATAAVAQAKLNLIRLKAESELNDAPAAAAMTLRQAGHLSEVHRQAVQDVENLTLRAPLAGKIVDCDAISRTGQFITEGMQVATIASGDWIVRSLATAENLADAKPQVGQKVRIRLLGQVAEELSGIITNVAVTGSNEIPSPALTQLGGGTIPVEPETMIAREPFFEISIGLDNGDSNTARHGMNALVRLEAKPQTIGVQLYRAALRFIIKLRT